MIKVKADDVIPDTDPKITHFEYLIAEMEVLREELELIRSIINQHGLTLKSEKTATTNIECEIWERLDRQREAPPRP